MKRSILIVVAILLCLNLRAQQTERALVAVYYKHSHLKDTANKSSLYTERMVLWADKNASVYKSYDKMVNDSVKKTTLKEDGKGGYIANTTNRKKTIGTQIFKYGFDKKMIVLEKLVKTYAISEEYPAIDWKISPDTVSFGGIKCQMAEATFKGRNYIAWFAPDLPYNTGPWKLCGLPGLILQAYDDKHEVEFTFDGLTPGSDTESVALPTNAIPTTRAGYNRLIDLLRNDPTAFFAQNEVNGIKLSPQNPELFKNAKKPDKNPIELKP